jgi:hypothetical protein
MQILDPLGPKDFGGSLQERNMMNVEVEITTLPLNSALGVSRPNPSYKSTHRDFTPMANKSPFLIMILVILLVLGGLAAMSVSIIALLTLEEGEIPLLIFAGIAIGLIYLLLAWGTLRAWAWIWTHIVVLQILAILNVVYSAMTSGPIEDWEVAFFNIILAGIIPIIILLLMRSRKVKEWFGRDKKVTTPEPTPPEEG